MEALRARRRRLQVRRLQSHGLAPAVHAWDGRREERTNTDGWHARSHSQHKLLTTTGCTYAGHSRHQWCGGEKKARLPLLHTLQILEAWCPPTHGKTRNTAWSYVLSLHSRRRACVCVCVAVSLLVKKYLCIQSKLMTSIKHPRAAHTCRVKSTRHKEGLCSALQQLHACPPRARRVPPKSSCASQQLGLPTAHLLTYLASTCISMRPHSLHATVNQPCPFHSLRRAFVQLCLGNASFISTCNWIPRD